MPLSFCVCMCFVYLYFLFLSSLFYFSFSIFLNWIIILLCFIAFVSLHISILICKFLSNFRVAFHWFWHIKICLFLIIFSFSLLCHFYTLMWELHYNYKNMGFHLYFYLITNFIYVQRMMSAYFLLFSMCWDLP